MPGRIRAMRQRGAISVEFALATPALLLLILGGIHLGRALTTRHRLADATSFATRAAAIARTSDATFVRNTILARLSEGARNCSRIDVTTRLSGLAAGTSQLEVNATCRLRPAFGAGLIGAIGPDEIAVTAAFPF